MKTRKRQVAQASLILSLFLLGAVLSHDVGRVHAQTPQSLNTIVNPGFETSPPLTGWVGDIYDDGNYYSTITTNNTKAHTGTYSARLDVSNNSTAIRLGVKTNLAHITLIQYLQANTLFSNLTDRPDGLNLWFYLQPKFAGFPLFEVRVRAGSTAEMDYIYENPSISLGFANSTTGSEGGKPLKQFIFPTPQFNQWTQLVRDLRTDWMAPLKLPNGTITNSFQLNDTFGRFEADAYFYKDQNTGSVYAETAWVDDVAIYVGNTIPLPSFTFQDWSGTPVDTLVTWKIFNMSGAQVNLPPGTLIPSNLYTLKAYYHGYPIFKDPITPITPSPVQLAMIPTDSSRSGFITINSTITSLAITENTPSQIAFDANGTQASLIVADIPSQPVAVVQKGILTPAWTYNATTRLLVIATSGLGSFSISYVPVMLLPTFTFQDLTGAAIKTAISSRIINSQGVEVQPSPGTLVPIGAYTLQVAYGGYSIYRATITPSIQFPVHLAMIPLGTSNTSYIAFNSTVNSISISENSQSRITFTSSGTGPTLVIVKVPARPVSVEKDGSSTSAWSYNSTTGAVAIQSATLGTFSIIFSSTTDQTLLLLVGAVIAGVAMAASATIIWRRRIRTQKTPSGSLKTTESNNKQTAARESEKGPKTSPE